jgi:hypothetical protein
MMEIVSRLDIPALFWEVDDYCQKFAAHQQLHPQLESGEGVSRSYNSRLSLSEVMTIAIGFHGSDARTFKGFYTQTVLPHWRDAFPELVSYTRFVELMAMSVMPLCNYLQNRLGDVTGIAFVDATPIEVCHRCRAGSHRLFQEFAGWSKNSMGWHFGFKLHLIINDRGELLATALTPGNTDDRKPVPEMTQRLWGKLFGDRGYLSQALFDQLYERGVQLVTNLRKNMKNRLVSLHDKLMLRKRVLIETVNDQLKNISQVEHSRHRSPWNFLVNLLAGLVAYTFAEKKPSLHLNQADMNALALSQTLL